MDGLFLSNKWQLMKVVTLINMSGNLKISLGGCSDSCVNRIHCKEELLSPFINMWLGLSKHR